MKKSGTPGGKGTPRGKGAGPSFKEGDLVFAKVKGYPAWPARVSSPADEKGLKYHVFFYGTYETAVVPRDTIWIYNQETKEKYGKQKRKSKLIIGKMTLDINNAVFFEVA